MVDGIFLLIPCAGLLLLALFVRLLLWRDRHHAVRDYKFMRNVEETEVDEWVEDKPKKKVARETLQ